MFSHILIMTNRNLKTETCNLIFQQNVTDYTAHKALAIVRNAKSLKHY